uniref:Uncharacterized protein n=1 Tax=Oryza meridionalis TaxID=40149 RepID=A0A0E0C7J6_9ORYZ
MEVLHWPRWMVMGGEEPMVDEVDMDGSLIAVTAQFDAVAAGAVAGQDGGEGGDSDEAAILLVHGVDGVPHGLLHPGLAEDVDKEVPGVAGVIHRPPRPDEEADDGFGAEVADVGPEHLLHDLRRRADAVGGELRFRIP